MSSLLHTNSSKLSNIDFTKLIDKIIEVDSNRGEISDSKRIYFEEKSLEVKNVLQVASEVVKELFDKDILFNPNQGDMSAYWTKASQQCESVLETLGINLELNPRKVCSNFTDVANTEKSLKELEAHFKRTLLKDIQKAREEGDFDTYCSLKKTLQLPTDDKGKEYDPLASYNFSLFNSLPAVDIDLYEMEYKGEVHPAKKGVSRIDTLLIEAKINNLEYEILTSLVNYYGRKYKLNDGKKEELKAFMDGNEEITQSLKNFIIGLRSGYLKRTAQYLYLDCLRQHFSSKLKYHQDEKYSEKFRKFNNYVERFFKFESLMEDILINSRMDEFGLDYNGVDYHYNGGGVDLTYLLRESYIYSALPFIGEISEPLSDSTDSKRENGQELYGIHAKLNGNVAKEGMISFDYQLKSISKFTADDYQLKEGKSAGAELSKALLFKYFLLELESDEYDATVTLLEDIEQMRNSLGSEAEIKAEINNIYKSIASEMLSINKNLSEIKEILYNGLSSKEGYSCSYERTISILSSMLPEDISQPSNGENILNIMKVKGFNTGLLKYTTLFEDEFIDESVYSFKYNFKISSSLLQPKGSTKKNFSMHYDLTKDKTISNFTLFPEFSRYDVKKGVKKEEVESYKRAIVEVSKQHNIPCIFIPYLDSDNQLYSHLNYMNIGTDVFYSDAYRLMYELVYVIILNVLISILAEDSARDVKKISKKGHQIHLHTFYRPIESKEEIEKRTGKRIYNFKPEWSESESFIKDISKSLEFTLSNFYNCKSQGYDISVKGDEARYRRGNANTSVNASKPRIFKTINNLEKLKKAALIIGTSVKLDERYTEYNPNGVSHEPYKSMINGEVITIHSNESGDQARINIFEKFHEFVDEETIHKSPEVFRDIVSRLASLGIFEIIYIVKAPYTTKMLEKPENTEMYFMNEEILKSMCDVDPRVRIYPLYINSIRPFICDKNAKAVMYTSDAEHISQNLFVDNRGMFPILQMNIQNPVNTKEDATHYSSLITYSTITGMYNDVRLNQSTSDIKNNARLKGELLSILAGFHASRYEKYTFGGNSGVKKSGIKKDPYEYLIGDKSIGRSNSKKYPFVCMGAVRKNIEINHLGLSCAIFRSINSL